MLPLKAEPVVSVTKDPNIEGIELLDALIEELIGNGEDPLLQTYYIIAGVRIIWKN